MRVWGSISSGAVCVVLALAPRSAQAGSAQFVSVGYLHSERWNEAGDYGNGVELTIVDYRRRFGVPWTDMLGLGGFVHLESVGDPGRLGFSSGLQLNYWLLGLETGVDYVAPAEGLPERTGLYVGGFASAGIVALGWHAVLPQAHASEPTQGFGHAFTVALKIPIPFMSGNGYSLMHGGGW